MNSANIIGEVGQQQQGVPLGGLFQLSATGVLAITGIAKV
jgi:hypothetical protein